MVTIDPQARNQTEERELCVLLRQMPRHVLNIDALTAAAIIRQIQIAAVLPSNRGAMPANARGLARQLIDTYPAPVKAIMDRGWNDARQFLAPPPSTLSTGGRPSVRKMLRTSAALITAAAAELLRRSFCRLHPFRAG